MRERQLKKYMLQMKKEFQILEFRAYWPPRIKLHHLKSNITKEINYMASNEEYIQAINEILKAAKNSNNWDKEIK